MTKRQRQARIRQVRDEFLGRLRQRFPLVELVSTEEQPSGTTIFRIYAPYEDLLGLIDTNADRIAELAGEEDLHVMILPVSEKPSERAA